MAKQSLALLFSIAVLLAAGTALAQEDAEESFNLIVGEEKTDDIAEEVLDEPKYVPAIEKGQWNLALTLGYFNMTKTLLQHERLIYKATDEAFFYGDVELVNESAFNPILRVGYNLSTWLALELQGGVTFSDYQATITNPFSVDPAGGSPTPVTEIGEFDAERRSALIFIGNLNLVWYPLNMDGDGTGRWHPYVTAGGGMALYNIDSNYVDTSATGGNLNVGAGLKIIADDLVSLRVELLYQRHEIQFEPAAVFDSQDDNTIQVPVYEFDELGRYSEVRSFASQALSGIAWQIGFTIAF